MAPPAASPVKGKSRKWLLYAAGAGVLLALLFLLRKSTPAAETSTGGTVTAPENAATGAGGTGETPAVTDAVPPPPSLNLGSLNPGESVSAREATAGGEIEASRAREASPAESSANEATAARLKQVEGQYAKSEAEKAKLLAAEKAPAASHATKGHPAAKPKHGHGGGTTPKPAAKTKPAAKPAAKPAPKPAAKPAAKKAAPKHKKKK